MTEFWKNLLASDFMPHGVCFLWNPEIVWLQLQQVILNLVMNGIEAMHQSADGARTLVISSRVLETGEVAVRRNPVGWGWACLSVVRSSKATADASGRRPTTGRGSASTSRSRF